MKNNSIRGKIIFMEEFRIGLDRSVGLLIPCPTHNLTGGGGGSVKVRFPYTPLVI